MTNQPIPDLPAPLATAQAEGRLTTASILDLHSANGATIAVSTQPVLMVGTSPPPGPMRKVTAFFEGGEHTFLGDQVLLNFEGQTQPTPAASYPILLPNELKLTYGQIVGLAGDFYGFPNRPISADSTGQTFQDAFDSLARLPASNAEATLILQTMKTEIDAANKAIADGFDPSSAYDALGDRLNYIYNYDTGGGVGIIPRGRYLLLAAKNWDHFGATAVAAYTIGHTAAQLAATHAAKLSIPSARRAALELAYAMNAFADHFLTDLFSAGHLRTPRKEMHDLLMETTGSLCARMMHDEDSCYGLQVTNAKGETWTAYGDKRLRDKVNAANLQRAEAAVQLSADEVWHAFQGSAPASGALQLIPDFGALLANPNNPANGSPLFIASNAGISKRKQFGDRKNYEWTTDWYSVTTYMTSNWYHIMAACGDREKFMMESAFLAITTNGADPALILYDRKGKDAYGPVGTTSVPGLEVDLVNPLMIGDINRDGLPEIIHFAPNNIVMQAFGLSDTGAYTPIDSWPAPALRSAGSLVVDANDDGDDRVVCTPLDFESQNIGLKTYRLMNNHFFIMQDTPDLSVPQLTTDFTRPDPVLVAVDMNGDGKQQIAMLGNASTPCDVRTTSQSLYLISADSNGDFSVSWKGDIPITPVTPPTFYPLDETSRIWVLPVDCNGDGKTELAQMFAYRANPATPDWLSFGMHLYGPDGAGGYKEIAATFQMGTVKADPIMLVADYDGDGCDEIISIAPADYTENGTLTIWKYKLSPYFHATDWFYQTSVVDSRLCPPVINIRGTTVVNKHKKGSNDHIVVFRDNAGQLTMRVIGGGKQLRILADYPLEASHPATAGYDYYSLELHGGDVD
jgi:hypothetical protein